MSGLNIQRQRATDYFNAKASLNGETATPVVLQSPIQAKSGVDPNMMVVITVVALIVALIILVLALRK